MNPNLVSLPQPDLSLRITFSQCPALQRVAPSPWKAFYSGILQDLLWCMHPSTYLVPDFWEFCHI